ncbi:Transposon Tf2-6 polyprotein [Smittium culicis]|uniref:Transposon Tf2-6 polyprotein n=1 Tax=Smittium culicis TaxID=133412 RepID=A0A1R1YPX5_9FUNG|nr:Transposon Tf2-6 polyprotein [Smittium culicis]
MEFQPCDIILGANFIVASNAAYDPVRMTINFKQNNIIAAYEMMPSGINATEWAPLMLAAGAISCLPNADPDITAILREVASLFDPTPSIINTDFPHQLRLTTDQPTHARMRRYSPEEAKILNEHVKELYQSGTDHITHLKNVLHKLEAKGFKLNPKKCLFAVPKVEILGFTVSSNGQEIAEDKIKAVKKFPRPTSVTTVRRFLGMTSFCRSFINNFTEIAAPLYRLLEKKVDFHWSNECDKSFQNLIKAMTSSPVLAHPDTSKAYIMYTDASNIGIGASLHQSQSDGTVRPIAYASRKLLPAEANYCTSDKEALAVVYGFDKFHHYVHGTCTELHTDHRALITALKNEDPRGRIARWNSALQAYDYTVKHVRGLDNGLTDALSRDFPEANDIKKMGIITRSQGPPKRTIRRSGKLDVLASDSDESESSDNCSSDEGVNNDIANSSNQIEEDPHSDIENSQISNKSENLALPSIETITKHQQIDSKSKAIIRILENKHENDSHSNLQAKSYCITDKILHNISDSEKPRVYIPKALVKAIIYHHHDTPLMSHLGHRRTLDKIKQNFFWPKMSRDVFGYIQACRLCQLTKHSTLKAPGELQPIIVSDPFEIVSIDHCGPFTTTEKGNKYILVITDLLTRWVDAIAVPNTSAETTVSVLENRLIATHGSPVKLLSDNGAGFTSHLMKTFCRNYGIKHVFASPYHPETNGMTERFNRTLKAMIKAYTTEEQSVWDQHINMHLYAYRTARHEALGLSPFEALFGRKPRLPAEALRPTDPNLPLSVIAYEQLLQTRLDPIRKTISHNNLMSKRSMESRYNRKHRLVTYKIGDQVLLKRQQKDALHHTLGLSTVYTGPYQVINKIGRVSYLLQIINEDGNTHKTTAHINRIKKYNDREFSPEMGETDNVTNS